MTTATLTTALRRFASGEAIHAADRPWATQESLVADHLVQEAATRMHHQAWERRFGR